MSVALTTDKLSIHFGGLKAVDNLDLSVLSGSIFGIIGPNGAGKTTVFNMLTGVYQPTAGRIEAFGQSIVGKKPYEISHCGLSRTFQNIRLFKELSVLDNVLIALDRNPKAKKPSFMSGLFRNRAFCNCESQNRTEVNEFLKIMDLEDRQDYLARNLPYGDQRRLEIARALATGAKIILLDEPAAGMANLETEKLIATIGFIRKQLGITVILIEHDMELVMKICERIAVLDYGKKIAEGCAQEIQNNPKVIEAYLGKRKTDN